MEDVLQKDPFFHKKEDSVAATKHLHHATTPEATNTDSPIAALEDQSAVFTYQTDDDFPEIAEELGWFSDVGSTWMENTSLVGSTWIDSDVSLMLLIGEEDQSLFGDLDELPECSVVFRRYRGILRGESRLTAINQTI